MSRSIAVEKKTTRKTVKKEPAKPPRANCEYSVCSPGPKNPKPSEKWVYILIFVPIIVGMIALISFFSSCTLSVNTVHTQGSASDVVDEEQTPAPQVTTNIEIPVANPI